MNIEYKIFFSLKSIVSVVIFKTKSTETASELARYAKKLYNVQYEYYFRFS